MNTLIFYSGGGDDAEDQKKIVAAAVTMPKIGMGTAMPLQGIRDLA